MSDTHIPILAQQAIDRYWETFPTGWQQNSGNIRKIAAERFDITVEQFHILRHINKGVTSVSELAETRQISRSAISQAVDILGERGLITRRQDADDRRFIQLELTASGANMLQTIGQTNRAWMAEKLSGLSTDELQTLCQAFEILHHTFTEAE